LQNFQCKAPIEDFLATVLIRCFLSGVDLGKPTFAQIPRVQWFSIKLHLLVMMRLQSTI